MKILLIEDDRGVVELIPKRLAAGGIPLTEMRHADNLHDGGNIAAVFEPDVIVLDLALSSARGTSTPRETVDASRQLFRTHAVVVLTGYNEPELWKDTIMMGASDYLFKGTYLAKGNELLLASRMMTAYYRALALRHG